MIPSELRSRQQWVVWRERERAGKWTKVPYQAEDPRRLAKTNDPQTWSSYEAAVAAAEEPGIDGIGFVFTDDDPFCGVDFDDVIVDGEVLPEALAAIKSLDTYSEYSPSDLGVHSIGLASLKNGVKHKTETSSYGGGLEIYDRLRFFCVTGKHMPGTNVSIAQFDPAPILSAIVGDGEPSKSALGKEIGSRHDYIYHRLVELYNSGVERPVAEELIRSIARDVELPKREEDEVGRMLDHLYSQKSLENRARREAETLEVKQRGRQIFEEKRSVGIEASVDEILDGDEFMDQQDEDSAYIIDPILPSDANVLIVAQKKTGKTTMVLNLFYSLLDDQPFLGSMEINKPEGSILYINYEMNKDSIRNWLRKQGIEHIDRLKIWNLKGRRLRIWNESVAKDIARYCQIHKVWCIVIDTQIMSMRGYVKDTNADMEIADYQAILDELKVMSGVKCIILVHHAGREDKGARGSARYEDWPDAIWTMHKKADGSRTLELDMIRYYDSKDALPDELVLSFDRENDRLTWDGETRYTKRETADKVAALQALLRYHKSQRKWPTRTTVRRGGILQGDNKSKTNMLHMLERQGLVEEVKKPSVGVPGRVAVRIAVTDEGRRVAK